MLPTHPPRSRAPRCSYNRGGFTLVEILVVIAIIALLAGVALPAVTGALKKAKENAALQTAHGLSLALFQFANDNDGVYPGTVSTAVPPITVGTSTAAFQLMVPTYISSTDALFLAGPTGKSKWAGTTPTGFTAPNVCWDLTTLQGNLGLTTNDPDGLPVVMSTGATEVFPAKGTTGTACTATISDASTTPFGTDGIAVGYKDMSSAFKTATANNVTSGFPISSAAITAVNTYTTIQP